MKITEIPSPLMGEGEGGVDMVCSPSPLPSPTRGEGDNQYISIIFTGNANKWNIGRELLIKV
jgi:hypothetical protein